MAPEQDCSQSASQKLPDTCPISQNELSQTLLDNQNALEPWGRLYPTKPEFRFLELTKKEYTFGRGPTCDHFLEIETNPKVYGAISKVHFRIRRTNISTTNYDDYIVYLDDLSFNGTFVNGRKIGKGNSVILENNNEISICFSHFKAFIYISSNLDIEVRGYPEEVRMKYGISRVLGTGSFGQVRLVFDKTTGKALAMKVIQKKRICNDARHRMYDPVRTQREVDVLKALSHVFVIKFENVIDTIDYMFILTEYMEGGELFDRVKSGPLTEADAKLYFFQLAMAVKYLHKNDIIHRDIKLENILLSSRSSDAIIKLSDFGFSKFLDSESVMMTYCGTPLYIAPEILQCNGSRANYDKRADIWSMGVVLYICLSGVPPFTSSDANVLKNEILSGNYAFPRRQWGATSRRAIHLVKKMLTVNPNHRISMDDILLHGWLSDKSVSMRVNRLLKAVSRDQLNLSRGDSEVDSDTENDRRMKRARIGN